MNSASAAAAAIGIRQYRIEHSHACPSLEPIPVEGFKHEGQHFTADELAIAGRAIDAGLFYTEEVKDFSRDAWKALHPAVNQCLTESEPNHTHVLPEEFAARRQCVEALKQALATAPRGTWGRQVHHWIRTDGVTDSSWNLFIATGRGDSYGLQCSPIVHAGRLPTYEDALEAMVGYEIYLVDRAEKARREQARSRDVVQRRGLTVGAKLGKLRLGGTSYTSAVIEDVSDTGYVTLQMTKRGSRNRWRWSGLAQSIKVESWTGEAPAYGELVVSET